MLLVEVLIAVLLLTIAAAGSVALLGSVFFSTSYSGAIQTATRLGQVVVDRTMTEPFDLMGTGPGTACRVNDIVYANGTSQSAGPGDNVAYRRDCVVTTVPGGSLGAGLKRVAVTVTFTDAQNQRRRVSLGTLRAN